MKIKTMSENLLTKLNQDLVSATPTVPVATLNNLSPGDPVAPDEFGFTVAISGTQVVVGAPWDGTITSGAGSAYVYDLAGATPTLPVVTLNSPSPGSDVDFGDTVAISGTRVVVGVKLDSTGVYGAGGTFIYDTASATPTVPAFTLHNPSPEYRDAFGFSVGISGTRVVVGAPDDISFGNNQGSVYVYDLASDTPTVPVVTLRILTGSKFGWSVAISGTRIVVGSIGVSSGNNY